MKVALVVAVASILFGLSGVAAAQEREVVLKEAPGRGKVLQCAGCHSLDYIQMNSPFMNQAGWNASVNKMIHVFGAPIPSEDVDDVVAYLARYYGNGPVR
ncbi:MAG TPA: hypothetical protein VGE93_23360 [Bryobacteraceae bacterium]